MTKIKIDDNFVMDGFKLIEKFYDNPEKLTRSEKKRLRELGLKIE